MDRVFSSTALAFAALLGMPAVLAAQSPEVVATRAAGMGGAFVAVADDASAVYWNPAGLASGAFVSLLLDRNASEAIPAEGVPAVSQSATFAAIATPALGLSYYRVRATSLGPAPLDQIDRTGNLTAQDFVRVRSLITHHTGATLVQSITDNVAVGATLKLVRGIAATRVVPAADREDLLDEGDDLVGDASNAFDADIGVMANLGRIRLGLTVRNATEPEFDSADGSDVLGLERQTRAGIAFLPVPGVVLAADLDLERLHGPLGEARTFAAGAEAQILPRAFVRTGVRLNTLGDLPAGRTPAVTVGGSYAVFGSVLIDGQATFGSDGADRGWGLAARMVF